MEDFNAVNDAQDVVVDVSNTADDTDEGAFSSEEEWEEEDTEAFAPPHQDAETNRAFAQMRREMEQAQRERDLTQRQLDEVKGRLANSGYTGDLSVMAQQMEADCKGISLSALREQEEQQKQRILMSDEYQSALGERDFYRDSYRESQYRADLEEIKKEFPDVKAKKITDLGIEFLTLRAHGIDNLTAYRATQDKRGAVLRPTDIGKVSAAGTDEKNYYTNEELDNLTPEQLKNEKVYQKAMRSLLRLK